MGKKFIFTLLLSITIFTFPFITFAAPNAQEVVNSSQPSSNIVTNLETKPIIGAVILFDKTPPNKNDMYDSTSFFKDKKYPFEQLNEDYNINKTIRQEIYDKYSSRFLTLESNNAVTENFIVYRDDMKTSYNNLDIISGFADKFKYDYLIITKTKITRIERITEFGLFAAAINWRIDVETDVQLYSKIDGKILYEKTIKQTVRQPFSGTTFFSGIEQYEQAFRLGISNVMQKVVNQFEKDVPSITPKP